MGAIERARTAAANRVSREQSSSVKRMLATVRSGNLDWLATVYGTDKGRHHWRRAAHDYMPLYTHHLRKFNRHRKLTLLEIGIEGGQSMQMWHAYFTKAVIAGVDIKAAPDMPGDRYAMFQGEQQDATFLASVVAEIGAPDIVIDDGSHIGEHINATFSFLWPRLARGGVYVIEDTQTADDPDYGGGPGAPNTSTTLAASLVSHIRGDVAELHVYPEIVFIGKG